MAPGVNDDDPMMAETTEMGGVGSEIVVAEAAAGTGASNEQIGLGTGDGGGAMTSVDQLVIDNSLGKDPPVEERRQREKRF